MQWMNLPPNEKLDLEKFVNGHCNLLYVAKEKALSAWLKVAFASPVGKRPNVYRKGPELMLWPSKALRSVSFQISHSSGDPPP